MKRTIPEINERIKKGKVVVLTAEEAVQLVKDKGVKKAAAEVDVVTTGTFGPMCSSGAFFNVGHAKPKIKFKKVWLNDIEAYAGLAAVDIYLGATEMPVNDPENEVYPGSFAYGGGHVIHDLVAGKEVKLKAVAYGTDCYPRKEVETVVTLKEMNEAYLFNPRNCYQNYNCAINLSDKIIYTYMGVLKPNVGNANYCSAAQLSPLLKDPLYRTTGIGTRIFLGGGIGYVSWQGTQHNPEVKRTKKGAPATPAGTLAVTGDLKQMKPEWLLGASFMGYGSSLIVGMGIPIPIIDQETMKYAALSDEDLVTQIVDYSHDYPQSVPRTLGQVTYAELRSGSITYEGKKVPTVSISSYSKARKIAGILKDWISDGNFRLSQPVEPLPGVGSGLKFKPLPAKGKKR
jgi:uncharacterized protein (DUF39 family)